MKLLALLGLAALALTSCGPDTTALDPIDSGSGGGAGGEGGAGGGPGRGRPDGSIEVTGGSGGKTGGNGGSTGGSGGSTGGSGGSQPDAGVDAGNVDASPKKDASDMCEACNAFVVEYGNAIRNEQVCNPAVANQCVKQTPGQLTCGCPVWVTTTVLSDDVRARFVAAGCLKCFRFMACP
ncbi:MAG TPA: hypothetical protein VN914_06350, partial [Polyangia bacterium]|nr:hypothetical protein [Polyangia bacterium]